jgi:Fe-S cluster biosynthesis and repair protein YggX
MEDYTKDVLPSLIYTFKYNSEHIDKQGKYEFRDYVPVIFCMYVDKDYVYGINFNLLPNDVRARLLDVICKSNPEFYSYGIYNEGLQLSNSLLSNLMNEDSRKKLLNVFDGLVGVKVSNAYRRYKKSAIENIRLIEYDVWDYIPSLVFTDSIRGANLAAVQKSIIESSK